METRNSRPSRKHFDVNGIDITVTMESLGREE